MLMTTELYDRMNRLCGARVMFDDEQAKLEQMVFDAIVAVKCAEELLDFHEAQWHHNLKEYDKKIA